MSSQDNERIVIAEDVYLRYLATNRWPLEGAIQVKFEKQSDLLRDMSFGQSPWLNRFQDSKKHQFHLKVNPYRLIDLPLWQKSITSWNRFLTQMQNLVRDADGVEKDYPIGQSDRDLHGIQMLNVAFEMMFDLGIVSALGKDSEGNVASFKTSTNVLGKKSIEDFFPQIDVHQPSKMGEKLIGWVKIGKEIGRGGQGVVYRVFHRHAFSKGNLVPSAGSSMEESLALMDGYFGKSSNFGALKEVKPFSAQAKERLTVEIAALKNLNHENILEILDSDLESGWFVMEYFRRGTLLEGINNYKHDWRRALSDFSGLVEAVASLHKEHLIHRDIKPGNIFIGESGRLVLGDFGLVFNLDAKDRITKTDESVGTDFFMPPFAYNKRMDEINETFDVYSLGKILWCMLMGRKKMVSHKYGDLKDELLPDQLFTDLFVEILNSCVQAEESKITRNVNEILAKLRELQTTIH